MNEQKSVSTFFKVTAILCAITALFSLIAFFASEPAAMIQHYNGRIEYKEAEIVEEEERITRLGEENVALEAQIATKKEELKTAEEAEAAALAQLDAAQTAVNTANSTLDAVCLRSYYSSYFCEDECKPLHDAVSKAVQVYDEAKSVTAACAAEVEYINYEISTLEESILNNNKQIEKAERNIEALKETIKELKSELGKAWVGLIFNIIVILVVVAALALFAKGFYTGNIDDFILYACGGLAVASLVYLIMGEANQSFPLSKFFLNPHFWNLVTMGCFAAVLKGNVEKPVHFRTFAIISAVITGLLGVAIGNPLLTLLYGATMICTAFVLVSLVFTEYIPMAKHLFLTFITLGIWLLVWFFHVTKNLNKVTASESRRPGWEMFLCAVLPLYGLYWILKTAETVELYGEENGKIFKLETLCIAFGLICPLFATVLIQNKINLIVGKPVAAEPAAVAAPVEEIPAEEAAEEETAPAEAE